LGSRKREKKKRRVKGSVRNPQANKERGPRHGWESYCFVKVDSRFVNET